MTWYFPPGNSIASRLVYLMCFQVHFLPLLCRLDSKLYLVFIFFFTYSHFFWVKFFFFYSGFVVFLSRCSFAVKYLLVSVVSFLFSKGKDLNKSISLYSLSFSGVVMFAERALEWWRRCCNGKQQDRSGGKEQDTVTTVLHYTQDSLITAAV